jgi:hypothetical protein
MGGGGATLGLKLNFVNKYLGPHIHNKILRRIFGPKIFFPVKPLRPFVSANSNFFKIFAVLGT